MSCFDSLSLSTSSHPESKNKYFGSNWNVGISSRYSKEQTNLDLAIELLQTPNIQDLETRLTELLQHEPHHLELVQDLLSNYQQNEQLSFFENELIKSQSNRPKLGQSIIIQTQKMKEFFKKKKPEKSNQIKSQRQFVKLSESHDYPFIFDSKKKRRQYEDEGSFHKYTLPLDTIHINDRDSEEFILPASYEYSPFKSLPSLPIQNAFPVYFHSVFSGYQTLNQMQSACHDCAFNTNENMLVCAPTGAGKTDIAMMVLLHTVNNHIEVIDNDAFKIHISTNAFKIVYIAPMKALASEIVKKFSSRLSNLKLVVKEYTGDMQLSREEIQATQIIVTTPEKWDVITRKGTGSDSLLLSKVRLVIIDEVHLLHDSRGTVLEAIVARTLRQVEQSQRMIRIVGLSATLPNYQDIAAFLRVNPYKGLFYFDGSFRPVPLTQEFVGVKNKSTSINIKMLNQLCLDKIIPDMMEGHQVLIFVHSRNETVKTAYALNDLAKETQVPLMNLLMNDDSLAIGCKTLNNRELKKLVSTMGIGVHHAGLGRSDRHTIEELFLKGHLRLLICTATLAWGVNLPAHTVLIKGTLVYDEGKGSFVDLSILDVLQIFGRAGRPQYETQGRGILITTHDKLSHYLTALTQPIPIESHFNTDMLVNHLNAEIQLRTVTTMTEAFSWLKYTYFWIRMRKNPLVYGITWKEMEQDPSLEVICKQILERAALTLHQIEMIKYKADHQMDAKFIPKELGRIASHYYLDYETIEKFTKKMAPCMNDTAIISMFSDAKEWNQIKLRDQDEDIFMTLTKDDSLVRIPVHPSDWNTTQGKVSILIQLFISRWQGNGDKYSSIVADIHYISQNSGRLFRSLFEISMVKGWSATATKLLDYCHAIEHRLWPNINSTHKHNHPLMQCAVSWTRELEQLESWLNENNDDMSLLKAIKEDVYLNNHPAITKAIDRFPLLCIQSCHLAPLSLNPIYQVNIEMKLECNSSQPFWIWIILEKSNMIIYCEYITLKKGINLIQCQIVLPRDTHNINVTALSDRYYGSNDTKSFSITPRNSIHNPSYTELLMDHQRIQPLPITALHHGLLEEYYNTIRNITYFDALITQSFHTLYYTNDNVIYCAPSQSGQDIICELAIWNALRRYHDSRNITIIYMVPWISLQQERMESWKKFCEMFGLKISSHPDMFAQCNIFITTPEQWISMVNDNLIFSKNIIPLIIMDEIQLLSRHAFYEYAMIQLCFFVSKQSNTRIILISSTPITNISDIVDWWFHSGSVQIFNYHTALRPIPLLINIQGFPERNYHSRMMSMNRFIETQIIKPDIKIMIFASGRKDCIHTAQSLLSTFTIPNNASEIDCQDEILKHFLSLGIGIHHGGLSRSDQNLVERLFQSDSNINIVITTQTLTWKRIVAPLVIIKGTEYTSDGENREEYNIIDMFQMIEKASIPYHSSDGICAQAWILCSSWKKSFYKQMFLIEDGICLESRLGDSEQLANIISTEHSRIKSLPFDALAFLSWSFLAIRFQMNPLYYDPSKKQTVSFYKNLVQNAIDLLVNAQYIKLDNNSVQILASGKISQKYHISIKTMETWQKLLSEELPESFVPRMTKLFGIFSCAIEYQRHLSHNLSIKEFLSCNNPILERLLLGFIYLVAERKNIHNCLCILHILQGYNYPQQFKEHLKLLFPCSTRTAHPFLQEDSRYITCGQYDHLPAWINLYKKSDTDIQKELLKLGLSRKPKTNFGIFPDIHTRWKLEIKDMDTFKIIRLEIYVSDTNQSLLDGDWWILISHHIGNIQYIPASLELDALRMIHLSSSISHLYRSWEGFIDVMIPSSSELFLDLYIVSNTWIGLDQMYSISVE